MMAKPAKGKGGRGRGTVLQGACPCPTPPSAGLRSKGVFPFSHVTRTEPRKPARKGHVDFHRQNLCFSFSST